MQYSVVGESGKDYVVKINRGGLYATMTIRRNGQEIYNETFLPVCKTQIECEDNCERIARQYTK